MFDRDFAQRLLKWSAIALIYSITILSTGILLAYGLDARLSIGWQAVGHYMIVSGALGIKLGYIARLAAQDVLNPYYGPDVSQLRQLDVQTIPHVHSPSSRAA